MGHRRNICLFLVFFGVFMLLSSAPIVSPDAQKASHGGYPYVGGLDPRYTLSDREQHTPITIGSNSEFASMAQTNGWPGSGTSGDPYIIAGLEIDVEAIGGSCITIINTDVYFRIVDCFLTGATSGDGYGDGCGIRLVGVWNGELRDNILPDNQIGIALGAQDQFGDVVESRYILISGNDCSGSSRGIVLYGSSTNEIEENLCHGCGTGIELSVTYDPIYTQTITSDMNWIRNNTITGATDTGIKVMNSHETSIVGNEISESAAIGLGVQRASLTTITDNIVRRSTVTGVRMEDVGATTFSQNILLGNGENAVLDSTQDGNVVDSNLWLDYGGWDDNYDGVGDTPYIGNTFEDPSPRIWLNGYRLPLVVDMANDLWMRAEGEGWPGEGTESNPFIFEDYRIEAYTGSCINIAHEIDMHLLIRNCHLSQGIAGIHVENAEIGLRIEENVLTENGHGVLLRHDPIEPEQMLYVRIVDNEFEANSYGIYVSNTVSLVNLNDITGSTNAGIFAEYSQFLDIYENTITQNTGDAIHLRNTEGFYLYQNNCSDNGGHGLLLEECQGPYDHMGSDWFLANIFSHNEYGVYLDENTVDCGFQDNVFRGRTADAVDLGTGNVFERNTWWGYTGYDLNHDGLGDTPYVFTNNQDPAPEFPLHWITPPEDQTIAVGNPFIYDLDAESYWPDIQWSINDTKFTVNSDGLIENVTPLVEEFYALQVTVQGGGVISEAFTLTTQDVLPPVTTAEASGEMGLNGWYISDVLVTLTAQDYPEGSGSGVDYIEYYLRIYDDSSGTESTDLSVIRPSLVVPSWQRYDAPITVGEEGTIIVYFRAVDLAGNVEETKSLTLDIDKTEPVTTVTLEGESKSGPWFYTEVNVTLSATDTHSGVTETFYSFDGVSWTSYTGIFNVTDEGTHTLYFYSVDGAGNAEEPKYTEIKIDWTPPETSVHLEGILGELHYYRSDVNVSLSAEDETSGVAKIEYSFDWIVWEVYDGYFTITEEGETVIYYRATDNAGNTEVFGTQWVRIDKTPPELNIRLQGPLSPTGWYTGDVIITFEATDDLSGVGYLEFKLDGRSDWYAIPEGYQYMVRLESVNVSYRGNDYAGNPAEAHKTIWIDIDDPVSSLTLSGEKGDGDWWVSEVKVELMGGDPGYWAEIQSGLDYVEYSLDNITWTTYSQPFNITTEGENTVYYRAADIAGNVEPIRSTSVPIDTTPPLTTIQLEGESNGNGWFISDVNVTLSATDDISGVAATAYSFDGNTWIDYHMPFEVSAPGLTTIYYNSTDVAGNTEDTKMIEIRIDGTPPQTTLSLAGTEGLNGWYRSAVTVSLSAVDAEGSSTVTVYSLDGTTWVPYDGPFGLSDEGVTTVYYNSTDEAGNVEDTQTEAIWIDMTPPEMEVLLEGQEGENGWYVSDVEITIIATDNPSGIVENQYRLNDGPWTDYRGPFLVEIEGENEVQWSVMYEAGWVVEGSTSVKIDKTAPESNIVIDPAEYEYWYITPSVECQLWVMEST
ncbi:hypothetical protein EU546_03835, partial [Candidatus Thorarchaeota archaeon]